MAELIITEKPSAALKIATALADDKPVKKSVNKVPYYEVKHKGKDIFVVSAVGHLYTIAEKAKGKWTYPIFDVEWKVSADVNKSSAFTKKYLNLIKALAKSSDSFVVATDFDIEGEVIGYNIIRFACNKNDARRMKFSTLTKDELLDSYEHALPHIVWGQAEAGLTRHELDWLWGINLSRALTLSVKHATGIHKVLSSGRVQGPALHILVEREKEIMNFKPVPYWQIELKAKNGLNAFHKTDKFWEKSEAEHVMSNVRGKKAIVSKVKAERFEQAPPHPFDLTSLQLEAYRVLRISPKETLEIAQELYIASYISYPRTSSNQLPATINFKKIFSDLSKQDQFKKLAHEILKKSRLIPNNGKKSDPAHPAVYPTGVIPKSLGGKAKDVYELIVRRFMSTFAEPAVRQRMSIEIDVDGELFIVDGVKTLEPNWHEFYGRFVKRDEVELPAVNEGQQLDVKEFVLYDKQTQPPKRYTPASLVKVLERKNLGTKATRADIVENLYDRDYIKERTIEVTGLGMKTIEVLEKYAPEIVDEKLTRHFEREMDSIMNGRKKGRDIIEEAKVVLTKILYHFKKNEKNIGKGLAEAFRETVNQASVIGKCPNCGADLKIMYSKKNRSYFIACSDYTNCKTTYSLPKYALPKPSGKLCDVCNFPIVNMIRKGKKPYEYCINPNCKKKEEWFKKNHSM
ncbi:MAG: DNA topoisomerase I [Candidatus Nanoarchaeia archaeon]